MFSKQILQIKRKIHGMVVPQTLAPYEPTTCGVAKPWKGGDTPCFCPFIQQHTLCYNHAWYFPFHCEHFSVRNINVEARNRIGVENEGARPFSRPFSTPLVVLQPKTALHIVLQSCLVLLISCWAFFI